MNETKTIREWLNDLPEPYRSRAIRNAENIPDIPIKGAAISIGDAIGFAFIWSASPEGEDFWYEVSIGQNPELPKHLNKEE